MFYAFQKKLFLALVGALVGSAFCANLLARPYGVSLPLPSLVRGSATIFIGKLVAVVEPTPALPERTLHFQVDLILKGHLAKPEKLIVLRQNGGWISSVALGERVLWFLPAANGQGFTVPLGYTSGDFRVDASDYAISRNANRDLWADDGSLWDSGECSRQRYLDLIQQQGAGGGATLKYLRLADSGYVTQTLPLSFLTFAVLSCLSDDDYRDFSNSGQRIVTQPKPLLGPSWRDKPL